MKLNYNDIRYIIETSSKRLIDEDRMVMLPSLVDNPSDEEYEMYLVQNDNERKIDKRGYRLLLNVNGEPFEIRTINNNVIGPRHAVSKLVRSLNTNKEFQQNLLDMKSEDKDGSGFNDSAKGIVDYFIFLLNTYRQPKTITGVQSSNPTKIIYPLNIIFNDDKVVKTIEDCTKNIEEKFKAIPVVNDDESEVELSSKWINRYIPDANGGKGGLLVDVLNSKDKLLRGWFEYEKGKRVEYINLSSFSTQVASYLKKMQTAKMMGGGRWAPQKNKPIAHGNPESPTIDWERTVSDDGTVNTRYMTNSVDNQTISLTDDGKLQGTKNGDRILSGEFLGEQLAECMAYVINEKMGDNLCAILSIASSSNYNEKTMDNGYSQNKDNIIFHLRETFNVNNVITDPLFFKKASHLLEINKDILSTTKNKKEQIETIELIRNAYQSKIEQYLKYFYDKRDEEGLNKLRYCNINENPDVLDDNGFADLSFLKDKNYVVDMKNKQPRMFGDISINKMFLKLKSSGNKKWEIKSIPEQVKKYMKFFLTCSFDGTIKNIKTIKNEIKQSRGRQKGYSPYASDEENAKNVYFAAEDADNSGIVIFDDNFASGATTKEAARVLVEYLNINPQRILCITPGHMASK